MLESKLSKKCLNLQIFTFSFYMYCPVYSYTVSVQLRVFLVIQSLTWSFAKMRPFIDQSLGHVEKLASAHTVRWMPAKLWDFFLSWESGSGIIWFGSGYGFSKNERSDKLLQFSFFPCFNCTDQFSLDCSFKLKVTPVGWFFFLINN